MVSICLHWHWQWWGGPYTVSHSALSSVVFSYTGTASVYILSTLYAQFDHCVRYGRAGVRAVLGRIKGGVAGRAEARKSVSMPAGGARCRR